MNANKRMNLDGSTQGRKASDWSDPHQAPPTPTVEDQVVSSSTYLNSFSHAALQNQSISSDHWVTCNKHGGHGDLIANSETALLIAICNAEINKHKTRVFDSEIIYPTVEHKRCAEYFVSTDNRNTFGRYVCRASLTGTPVTTADIAKDMRLTRKAVTTMVNECIEAGWVVDNRQGGSRYLSATPFLVEGFKGYAKWAAENWTAVAMQIADLNSAKRLSTKLDNMYTEAPAEE